MNLTPASAVDVQIVERQLGRLPRGVEGIAARCQCQAPLVVFTAPRLPDGTPFPTCFYLTQPAAVKGCSTLEAERWMETLNADLAEDEQLAQQYRRAHDHYIAARESVEFVDHLHETSAGGMPNRVKCLHALLGHALAAGAGVNPIGDRTLAMLEERSLWDRNRCWCEPGQRPADFAASAVGASAQDNHEDVAEAGSEA